jgi:hypothetical protein
MRMNTIAFCGLDCETCPVLRATRADDDGLREKTAREWEKAYAEYIGKSSLETGEMNCSGCKSEGLRFIGCANCPIRACAAGKEIEGCWDCGSYAECGMIQGFHSHSPEARDRSMKMRRG